jgi:hypothetical protein
MGDLCLRSKVSRFKQQCRDEDFSNCYYFGDVNAILYNRDAATTI